MTFVNFAGFGLFLCVLLSLGLGAVRTRRRWIELNARKLSPHSKPAALGEQGLFCHSCGYNLKGVESYRCPECGIVRLYSARQWKAKLAADAAKLADQQKQAVEQDLAGKNVRPSV